MSHPKVLTIAGSDSSAGAGIQADLKTFAALGCYGLSVITAVTAQNTQGVQAVYALPADVVGQQITSVLQDIKIDALKIGMVHNEDIIAEIAQYFSAGQTPPLVLDPVIAAKNGDLLLQQKAIGALKQHLFPRATLLTPNLPEAAMLVGFAIDNEQAMIAAAKLLCELGPAAVLIKGGHLSGAECKDCLYIKKTDAQHWFSSPRIMTRNTHGTGCTLSAAIAALLAKEYPLVSAVKAAKEYLTAAIAAGCNDVLGHGQGPVRHFYNFI